MKSQFLLVCIVVALLISACWDKEQISPEPTSVPDATPTSSLQIRTFEALWSAVNENYVFESFHGIDWQAVHDEYLPPVQAELSDDEFAETMRAMLDELPPGAASWQSRSERIEQDIQDHSAFEGIGAWVAFRTLPEPHVVLLSVMSESPAEQSGLKIHDSILAVDGVPVQAEEGLGVVERIRGPAGSQVILSVRSPGELPREVAVSRGSVTAADSLKLGFVPGSSIGYLLFPRVEYDGLINDVVGSLQVLTNTHPLSGLILDLRVASVSRRWPLGELLTLFADGALGEFYTRSEVEALTVEGQDYADSQKLPLIILVGLDTRGAPEVFAAALQAIGRAVVVGLPTSGSVQGATEFPLPDGSRAFIDTLSYRTPDGREIGLTGIEPSIRVEADWDEVTDRDDPVRDAAVEALGSSGG